MTRHMLALAAATAIGAAAAPALAQDAAPPPHDWADPQVTHPAPPPPGPGPEGYGAPYAHPLPEGVYPGGPLPYPPHAMPYPGGPGPEAHGPMAWHGEWSPAYGAGAGGGYWYAFQAGAPCGCPGYTWVPVPIETHYRYSAPIRHVEEVVEDKVVREEVVETKTVPVRRQTKYVKAAPKVTKGKVVKSSK